MEARPGNRTRIRQSVGAAVCAGVALGAAWAAPALADRTSTARNLERPAADDGQPGADGWSVADADLPADPNELIPTPLPDRWSTSRRWSRCHRYAGSGFCDSPLRVARPHGRAAELAERLDLGTLHTARHLLGEPPEPDWVEAVRGRVFDTLRWPVDGGRAWRGFGWRRTRTGQRRPHKGVDIGAEPGTPVLAVNDGLVAYAGNGVRGYGNLLMIVHADASTSMYAHLRAAYVFAGQRVRRSQVIGEVGHTGLARGPHLHFEWRRGGRPRDPAPKLAAYPDDASIQALRRKPRRRNRN